MKIMWLDAGRTAQCAPDPRYPLGMDVDMSAGAEVTCKANVPYPAPRCGQHFIHCETCGQKVIVTAAGRADDPRTVRVACKLVKAPN